MLEELQALSLRLKKRLAPSINESLPSTRGVRQAETAAHHPRATSSLPSAPGGILKKYRTWSEEDFRQLLIMAQAIQDNLGTMPEGTRLLLESHGFGRGRMHGLRRSAWKLKTALSCLLEPERRTG